GRHGGRARGAARPGGRHPAVAGTPSGSFPGRGRGCITGRPARLISPPGRDCGPVLAEGDPALMTETAPFNVSHVLRPVAAVIATGPADVAATVRWAAERGLPVAVQATGHGLFSDLAGHVLVCTHRMSWVEVDPEAGTARVGAGTRWKDVIEAAAPHGLAPLNGSTSHLDQPRGCRWLHARRRPRGAGPQVRLRRRPR